MAKKPPHHTGDYYKKARLKDLIAENDRLRTDVKYLKRVRTESGGKIASLKHELVNSKAENKWLKDAVHGTCRKIDNIMQPFLFENQYVDNGALTAIDEALTQLKQALAERRIRK